MTEKMLNELKKRWMKVGYSKGLKEINEAGLYPLSIEAMGRGYAKGDKFKALQSTNNKARNVLKTVSKGVLDIGAEDVAWAMNGLRSIGKSLGFKSIAKAYNYLPIMDSVNSIMKEKEEEFKNALSQSSNAKATSKEIFQSVFNEVMAEMDEDDIKEFTEKDFIYLVERLKMIDGYVSPSKNEIKEIITSSLKS